MIRRILMVILMVGVTLSLFSEPLTSNSITYDTENLDGVLVLKTTEKNSMILLQSESNLPLFTINANTREQLRRIVGLYVEMDEVASKANYRTSVPPSMRSYDHKVLQFRMVHTALEDKTTIMIRVDMENMGEYTEPIEILFTLEQLGAFLTTLDEAFLHMDSLRMEVSELRNIEQDI